MELLRPVFLLGSPRSGTTLARLMLNAHPQLAVPPECGFVLWLQPRFGAWRSADSADPAARAAYVQALRDCRKFDTWGLGADTLDAWIACNRPASYAELCAQIHAAHAQQAGRSPRFWGDKNNFHVQHVPALAALFPQARFVHIVRDGRDVACSYREVMAQGSRSPYAPRLDTDIERIATEWHGNVQGVIDALAALPPEQSHAVRYEDLTRDPQPVCEALCDWLDLPFAPQMLDFHTANRALQIEPASTLDWKRRTLEPVSDATVGRHRHLLSPAEQSAFTRVAGPLLQALGYPA